MKRFLKYLTIGAVLLPMSVKADMGAPGAAPIKMIPRSAEGAVYYNCDDLSVKGNVPYNKEIKVYYEEVLVGETYGHAEIFEDGEYYCIEMSDFITSTKEYLPDFDSEDTYDFEVNYEIYVNGSKGIKMRKGPSSVYDAIVTIPYGELVKATAASGDEGIAWAYVSYKGKSGWIYMLEGDAVYKAKPLRFYKDVEVYEGSFYDGESKVIGTIPAQEVVKDVYTLIEWTDKLGYYVEYNGIKGFVEDYFYRIEEINQKKLDKLEIKANTKLYQYPDDKELGSIDKKLVTSANGFYITEEMDEEIDDFVYETWLCIEYNGEYVWINKSSLEKESQKKFDTYLENRTEEDDYIQEVADPKEETKDKEEDESSSDKIKKASLGAKEIVILCVGGAIISALTAIVTIVLMNKKSKKKEVVITEQPQIINNIENLNVQNNDQNNNEK